MKDVIVVSYTTKRGGMLDEYEDQLAAAGIDFHLEPVVLEDGIVSITARWKFQFIRAMCDRFAEYERIAFTDAWDVLFFGTKDDLLLKIVSWPTFSAERNCWPEDLTSEIVSTSPWRFANAGMLAGSPTSILRWLETPCPAENLDVMEQAWLNRRLADHSFPLQLDETTRLFYTVSCDREDGALRIRGGKPFNARYGTYPQFLHFAGRCSSTPFRAMLRGATDRLCASA